MKKYLELSICGVPLVYQRSNSLIDKRGTAKLNILVMVTLAFPQSHPAVQNWQPTVSVIVENFGAICRVIEIDPVRGVLLQIMAANGQGGVGGRYYANPSLCNPVL